MKEHIPDSITKEGDTEGITVSKIKFYQDDIDKINQMSDEEALKYKSKLITQGKYTLDWGHNED